MPDSTIQPPRPAGYEIANSQDVPFPCREHAEQEAAFLNANDWGRAYGVKAHGGAWFVYVARYLAPRPVLTEGR